METGTKQLRHRETNHTLQTAKPFPIRAYSCHSRKTLVFFPPELIRVHPCPSVVKTPAFPPPFSTGSSQFQPIQTLKNGFLFGSLKKPHAKAAKAAKRGKFLCELCGLCVRQFGPTVPVGFRCKFNNMVKSQQAQPISTYKKKHSSNREKIFFVRNLHDFNESLSTKQQLAPPLLKRRPNAGNAISCHRTRPNI